VRRYGELLLRLRWLVALVIVAALGASLRALPGLGYDMSIVPLLRASEEAREKLQDFHQVLPPVRVDLLVILEWPRPVKAPELAKVKVWEEALSALPEVRRAWSLASVKVIERRGAFPVPTPFAELAKASSINKQVARHPIADGLLISADRRSIPIMVRRKGCTTKQLLGVLRRELPRIIPKGEVRLRIIGAPLVEEAMTNAMTRDMRIVLLLEGICFVLLLPLMFRTLRGLVVPLAVVAAAVLLNFGLMVLLGRSINLIGVSIPGLIAVIGLCDAIHMLHHFEEALSAGLERRAAVLDMLERVGVACFYTSFTTAIGFFSLAIAPHDAVVDFALSATLAVGVAFTTVIVLTPLLLSLWPLPKQAGARFLSQSVALDYGRPRLTLLVFGGLLAFSFVGMTRIVVDSHWLEELPSEEPAVKNFLWYEDQYNGFIGIETELRGRLDSIASFQAMERIQERLAKFRGVKSCESYTQWVREALGQPEQVNEPSLKLGLNLLRLSGARFPRHVLTKGLVRGRLIVRVRELGTRHFMGVIEAIEAEAKALPPGLTMRVGGGARLAHESARLVVTTMLQSMAVSLLAITLFIALSFRSWRIALVSIPPNLLPILVALGLNGWLGIELRIGIVMIYALGIGLAVDDTIHLTTRYMQERLRGGTSREILLRSLRGTGKALITTSLLLTCAALCYLPSSFKSLRDVGFLLTPIILVALAADLWLMPLLLEWSFPMALPQARTAETGPE